LSSETYDLGFARILRIFLPFWAPALPVEGLQISAIRMQS
jgi:hypothetical protein